MVLLGVPVTRVWLTSARDRARRPARSRTKAARVADGVEPAPVADGAELACVVEGSELACAGPATRHIELVAGHLPIGRVR